MNKRNSTLLLAAALFIIIGGLYLNGIFGIAILLLLASLAGIVTGICKKQKRLWQWSLALSVFLLSGAIIFFYLLSISGM